MANGAKKTETQPAPEGAAAIEQPAKPWGTKTADLPQYVLSDLYKVYPFLDRDTRERLGLMMKLPIFLQDPQVGQENPALAIGEIEVRLESGFTDGPTSSRIAVVDFNADTQGLTDPLIWNREVGWFRMPGEAETWLPEPPSKRVKKRERHLEYMQAAVRNPYFHQLNVWAIVQRVLEFYEEPWALGRPIPWGFDGNRLIVVPHAGYGENAFYDQSTKSLQFYYFGDRSDPSFTCLSHDIITHETGHAILDGIRPLYNQLSSLQTAAFHEFTGDLTAIMLALFNNDIRRFVAESTTVDLTAAGVLTNIAEQFGQEIDDRPYLRSALNTETMKSVEGSLSPHHVSEVLTGAMFEILNEMTKKRLAREPGGVGRDEEGNVLSPGSALWQIAHRFRRIALQPLDLCPPCDIQFVDYASAVLRNDILTNPVDAQSLRDIMLGVFHRRGLCTCNYQQGKALPEDCLLLPAYDLSRSGFVFHDIERVSRSHTAAYYFLSDNRRVLRIPPHQDVRVLDLYDSIKYGSGSERLPRQIILEYGWQEEVPLKNDPAQGRDFRTWNGKTYNLDCGGTLVFDERGNLLSWFRKPGTEHLTETAAANIQKKPKPTQLERAALADWQEGHKRKQAVQTYLSNIMRRGMVGEPQPGNRFTDGVKPVVAFEDGAAVRFEMIPYLRKDDFEEEDGWTVNY